MCVCGVHGEMGRHHSPPLDHVRTSTLLPLVVLERGKSLPTHSRTHSRTCVCIFGPVSNVSDCVCARTCRVAIIAPSQHSLWNTQIRKCTLTYCRHPASRAHANRDTYTHPLLCHPQFTASQPSQVVERVACAYLAFLHPHTVGGGFACACCA